MSGESKIHQETDRKFSLIETFRFDPEQGYIRLDLHLERLSNSARQLGFDIKVSDIQNELELTAASNHELRVRIELWPDGRFETVSADFSLQSEETRWDIAIAKTRQSSTNPLLRHKTSHRKTYVAAREEFSTDSVSEVILLNERDEVCEGTFTNLFLEIEDGLLLTPSIECGLLPGILRQQLISDGRVIESRLSPIDLEQAKQVYVGNSLRGLIKTNLV